MPQNDKLATHSVSEGLSSTKPNVLFIYADQHRADVMGAAGNELVVTPNLDRLANEGLRCTRAWTESPICQPARASLLTATFPSTHGILGNFAGDCDPEWATVPQALQRAGYRTASIGKTHYSAWPMGLNGPEDRPPPADEWIANFGFDHVVEEFDRYVHTWKYETPYMRFLRENDGLAAYQAAIEAHPRGTDHHWEAFTSPLPQELDLTSFLTTKAADWIDRQDTTEPWFLQLSYVQPHVPLMGDPTWRAFYDDVDIERTAPTRPSSSHPGWSQHLDILRMHSGSHLLTDDFVLAGARQYYAMVSLIDQKIGELLDLLETTGQLDNTLVLYSADHGEMLGDHELMAKMNFYQSSVTVPLIVRPPKATEAIVHDGPVQAIDVAATILDAAGAELESSQARSLLPVFDGAAHRDAAVSMIRVRPGMPTWVAVTDGDCRATFDRESGEAVELFNLTGDPEESTNLASEASPEHLAGLRSLLDETVAT